MSLPRSRSHNVPTNPRNKPQTIPKRKRNSRSKRLSNSAQPGAEFAVSWRTVRKRTPNNQYCTSKCEWSVPYPRTVREQLVPCGRSATSRRTVRQTCSNQKHLAQRIETKRTKNMWRTQRTAGWLTPRGQSAQGPRMVRQARRQQTEPDLLKVNTSFPLPDLPNQPRDCYQIIGEDEAPLGDVIPTNL
jgi:hypothetical protein